MDNKNTAEARWAKLNKKSKSWYKFIGGSLFKSVPLMIFLVIVIEIINGNRHENYIAFILTATIKIVLAYVIGIVSSGFEWNYLQNLINKNYTDMKTIKRDYILIYGLLMFGANFTISLLNPAFESVILTIT